MKEKLRFVWSHLEEFVLIPTFTISVIIVTMQVFMRYVMHNSLTWSEELTRYLYLWQTWIGVSYAALKGSHLRITILRDALPARGKQILEIFVTIIWLAFAGFVFYESVRAVSIIAKFGQVSSALRIPMKFCYASIPVGMALMSVRLVEKSIKDLLSSRKEGGAAT